MTATLITDLPVPAPSFKAATWNVFHGTNVKVLAPILRRQRARGVGLLHMGEAGGGDIASMLADEGMETFLARPQFRLAWDPIIWPSLVVQRAIRLSDEAWFSKGSTTPRFNDAADVILCDQYGRTLEAVSLHTAPFVQTPDATERRVDAAIDSFTNLGHLAEDTQASGFLAGGDSNYDPTTGFQDPELRQVILGQGTGLRHVEAPNPTHGRTRAIDNFWTARGGNLRVGEGWTFDGGGDHDGHGREFFWRI